MVEARVSMTLIPAATALTDVLGYSIVLVGKFVPTFIQPSMLLQNGLLTESDLSSLNYDLMMNDLSVLRLPWLQLSVEREKLSAMSTLANPAREPVRDFVLSLAELVANPRFTALGINRDTHIPINNLEEYSALLERLIEIVGDEGASQPIDHEIEDFSFPDWGGSLHKPVLRSLAVQSHRDDNTQGMLTVRVEPSTRISPGVYIQTNDHFDANPDTIDREPDQLLDQLSSGWGAATARADRIIGYVKEMLNADR
jgi:hypothetical protein